MKNIISFNTKFGWITAIEKNGKIIEINFAKKKNFGNSNILKKLKNNIKQFILKKTKTFNISYQLSGSKLQKKIWKELKKIPFGKTKSYKEIAKIVNTSPRYVGNVCGQNKHILIIPCHRVIRSDGSLGGFSAPRGIKLKHKFLLFEKESL